MIDMTPKEEAKKLLESFSKVKNMVYSTVKDRIIRNVIVQNATIHCYLLIEHGKDNEGMVEFYTNVIKELQILENEK